MTTTRAMISALVLLATMVAMAYGQTEKPGGRRAVPDSVALEVSLERTTFEVREPVIAHVTLTNVGDRPFRLYICDGGAPLRVAFQVAHLNASYDNHSLRVARSGPQATEIELGRGEATGGGSADARWVRGTGRALLRQTVGWCEQEEGWTRVGRSNVGPNASESQA